MGVRWRALRRAARLFNLDVDELRVLQAAADARPMEDDPPTSGGAGSPPVLVRRLKAAMRIKFPPAGSGDR